MYIEIEKTEISDRQFPSKKDGSLLYTRNQPALLWKEGENHPDKITIPLAFTSNLMERDQTQSHSIGTYTINDSSFFADNFGNLKLGQIELKKFDKQATLKRA